MDTSDPVVDVVIIGGGPAGMSAALVSGRARLRTVVVNAETPRNAVTNASHGFVTRDGIHPGEFLDIAKQQLEKYETVRYLIGRVGRVQNSGDNFVVTREGDAPITTRRVVLATGYRDALDRLQMPGVEDVYGKSVYPCPFCDGFEHQDERIAIFGGAGVSHFATVVRMWSDNLAIFTNGEALPTDELETLTSRGIPVYAEPIERLASSQGALQTIVLRGGEEVERDSGFIFSDFSEPATRFADDLGVPRSTNDWGMEVHEAGAEGKTQVPGVYVIGDAKSGFGGLIAAANEGSACASAIVHEVATARWAAAASTRNRGAHLEVSPNP